MQSVNSYFSPTLFKKNLTRFWPIWALFFLAWFFILPASILAAGPVEITDAWSYPSSSILHSIRSFGLLLSIPFGLLAAMAVFSYLYNNRSAGLLHALPIRREGLFLTNYLSGLCFFLIPLVAVCLLTLGAESLTGQVNVGHLLTWLLSQILMCLFFYSFAVFCAMFTGHLLALPFFYGILNVLVYGLAYLIGTMLEKFVFGFTSFGGMERISTLFTPALAISQKIGLLEHAELIEGTYRFSFYGMGWLLAYGFAGLVLTGLALFIYRLRNVECAGDVVSACWVRPVFKYGVSFSTAIVLGNALYYLFFNNVPRGPWVLLILTLLAGAAGYFAAEMLLKKSFRVFGESWKGALCFSLALVAVSCAMTLDITGFERRLTSPTSIVSAHLSNTYSAPNDDSRFANLELTDSADIELLTQLHAAIVAQRKTLKNPQFYRYSQSEDQPLPNGGSINVETFSSATAQFYYTRTDGVVIQRSYTIPVTDALLADPTSPAALLTQLINRPTLVGQNYLRVLSKTDRLVDAQLSFYNTKDSAHTSATLQADRAQLDMLLAAVQSDLAAGRLGRRYLIDNMERQTNCYYNDLTLIFYQQESAEHDRLVSAAKRESNTRYLTVTLQTTATDTLRVLRALGAFSDTRRLITYAEVENPDLAVPFADAPLSTQESASQ